MRRSIVALGAALTLACASGGPEAVSPETPETSVRAFLDAVRQNSLSGMSDLWGSSRGRAADRMDETELRKRLTVIQVYLTHESYEIIPDTDPVRRGVGDRRIVRVRLQRFNCRPVVPFTLERWRTGWLVADIDLAAIGNPTSRCIPPG